MAAEELARPGVEVIQEFRTQTPSVITPTLVPCVVGVAKQIVEVLADDGAGGSQLNPDALITLPALFIAKAGTGSPLRYTGLDGLSLVVSANESPDISIIFSDPTAFGLTPATVVSQVNKALLAALVTSIVAETVGEDRWQLRTVGEGEFQSILIAASTSPVVASTFAIGIGKTYRGLTSYNQYEVEVPPSALPDPNNNLDELAFELSTVRAFLFTGSGVGLQESKRDQAFLSRGSVAVAAVTTEGTVDLTTPPFPFFANQVLWMQLDVGDIQVVTIPATVNTSAQLLALLNGTSGFTGATASLGIGGGLLFTRNEGGYAKTIELVTPDTSSAMGLLGLVAETARGTSIQAIDDGNGDAVSPLLKFTGANFDAAPGKGSITGSGAPDLPPDALSTLILSDGLQPQTITFDGTETTLTLIKTAVEAVMGTAAGGFIEVDDTGPNLKFENTKLGDESYVEVIGGTALPKLDLGVNPAVTLEGSVSLNPDQPAVTTEGTVDLALDATINAMVLALTIDSAAGGPYAIDLNTVATWAALKILIDTLGGGSVFVATRASGTSGGLVVTSVAPGAAADIVLADSTGGLAELGLTAETVNGVDVFPTLGTETFQVSIDGAAALTVTLASETAWAAVKANVEGALAGVTATQGVNGGLVMTGTTTGVAATLEVIDDLGLGVGILGLTVGTYAGNGELIVAGAKAYGNPFKPMPGDELWVDGLYYAHVSKVAPGGLTDTLRVDKQVPIDSDVGQYWFIIAKNLVAGDATLGVSRPFPDMQIDLEGNVVVKPLQLRDMQGLPVVGKAPVYIQYSAVRQDVSPLASNPGLLRFDSTISLEQQLPPISTANPLALGFFFALINAPGIQVTGLGVDEVSADAPYGTVEAFTRSAEYLEGYEVYAIAPLTHDQTVAQVMNTHVDFMSDPTQKGERIVIWNPDVPTRQLDTLVASGTDGDGLTTVTFDTKVVNLSALLANVGITAIAGQAIPVTEGLFLDISGDDNNYSIEEVNGGVVTLRLIFAAGTNEDGFYSDTGLTLPLISEAFAVRVRGAELLTPTGQQDKARVASTVAGLGQSFQNRRFWMTFPDTAAATLTGLEQLVEGFYMNAAIVGMIGQQPPQQSFTNFPMTGFTRVVGSNDTFSESQLNQMAAGGAYIIVQETEGGPLSSRMALTTDLTSIETRTDSITKVVDFTAKFMRRGLRNFIGRFNITQGFLDTLGSVIQGLGGFLVETGVLIGLTLNSIVQDENARDTVLVDTTLDPPYPCNYIRLTLVV